MSDLPLNCTESTLSPQGRSEGGAPGWARRDVLKTLAVAGAGGGVFARALTALAREGGEVTPEMIRAAEWIAGIEFSEDERALMADGVSEALEDYERLRAVPLDNGVSPAIRFDATPPGQISGCSPPPASDLIPRGARAGRVSSASIPSFTRRSRSRTVTGRLMERRPASRSSDGCSVRPTS